MKQLFTALFTLSTLLAAAQYDSLVNIPQTKISQLYGQMVTVVELNELYPAPEWLNAITEASIIGKQFRLEKAHRDQNRPQIWVELTNTEETIYYRLTSQNLQHPPILVNGFYEKQKQLLLDRVTHLKMMNEYTTTAGKTKEFSTSQQFTCTGLKMLNRSGVLVPVYQLASQTDTINVPLTGFETERSNTINRFTIQ